MTHRTLVAVREKIMSAVFIDVRDLYADGFEGLEE
jgi:hypothetical protein